MVASLKRSWPPAISFSLFMHATLFVYRERLFSLPLILGRPLLSLTNSSTSKPGTELAGFYFSSPGMLPFLEHRHHALRKSKRRPCGERRTRRPYCQLNSQTIANRERLWPFWASHERLWQFWTFQSTPRKTENAPINERFMSVTQQVTLYTVSLIYQ